MSGLTTMGRKKKTALRLRKAVLHDDSSFDQNNAEGFAVIRA